MTNLETFESVASVKLYSTQDQLQKPEETILTILRHKLFDMRMLDLGVGGGRTTLHFAKLTKVYVGVDFAPSMIKACKDRFSDLQGNISFQCCDARSLNEFGSEYFDFVLFSFNGIDYISHSDRIRALKEIRRVIKKNGYFAFSSHNTQFIRQLYKVKLTMNPVSFVKHFLKFFLIMLLNGQSSRNADSRHVIFNDGTFRFRLKTYYIKPDEQLRQLEEMGFVNIRVFSLGSGEEVSRSNLSALEDSWVYYLCQV